MKKPARSIFWTFLLLAAIDVAATWYSGFPASIDDMEDINSVQRYFLYGTSVDRKIEAIMASDRSTPALMRQAGWIQDPDQTTAEQPSTVAPKIMIYGMSFSSNVGNQLRDLEPDWSVDLLEGPASSPNRTFAQFMSDSPEPGRIVIMGILASSVPMLGTVAYRTWNAEVPMPHLYPKIRLNESRSDIEMISPPAATLDDYRALQASQSGREQVQGFIRKHDTYYDDLTVEYQAADYSSIARLIRRAHAQRLKKHRIDLYYSSSEGFLDYEDNVSLLRLISEKFVTEARATGQRPIILLFNDRGYSDHLFQALSATLDEAQVPYISSHLFLRADEFDKFRGDGHFKPEYDRRIALCLRELIVQQQAGTASELKHCEPRRESRRLVGLNDHAAKRDRLADNWS